MPTAAVVAFRLGVPAGVAVVAASWRRLLQDLGYRTYGVAGDGRAEVLLAGLAPDSTEPPTRSELDDALAEADLVVVENLLTMPTNVAVSLAVAAALRGRPALLHHHDPPWEVPGREHVTELPADDPAWRHVVINRSWAPAYEVRGLRVTTIYNPVDTDAPAGDRTGTRRRLGVGDDEALLLHPVRALPHKNIPAALDLALAAGGTYWLPGPAEEGYGPTLDRLLADAAAAGLTIRRDPMPPERAADAYAACDAVLFPSTWEGFGLPPVEAAVHRRPAAVGRYEVADELRGLGFRWLPPDDAEPLRSVLAEPASVAGDLEHNRALAERCCSVAAARDSLAALLADAGWLP